MSVTYLVQCHDTRAQDAEVHECKPGAVAERRVLQMNDIGLQGIYTLSDRCGVDCAPRVAADDLGIDSAYVQALRKALNVRAHATRVRRVRPRHESYLQ